METYKQQLLFIRLFTPPLSATDIFVNVFDPTNDFETPHQIGYCQKAEITDFVKQPNSTIHHGDWPSEEYLIYYILAK